MNQNETNVLMQSLKEQYEQLQLAYTAEEVRLKSIIKKTENKISKSSARVRLCRFHTLFYLFILLIFLSKYFLECKRIENCANFAAARAFSLPGQRMKDPRRQAVGDTDRYMIIRRNRGLCAYG